MNAGKRVHQEDLAAFDSCFEFIHFHDSLVWHELHKTSMISVSVCSRLAGSGRRVVRERDLERATLTTFE